MTQPHHRGEYPDDWPAIAREVKRDALGRCIRCAHEHDPATGHTLTVHHFDGDKGNCPRWNLMALCQRCHLSVQARVDPEVPLMFWPSTWAMPYIAGFYAAGRGVPSPVYDLREWREEYERVVGAWPAWAPEPEETHEG